MSFYLHTFNRLSSLSPLQMAQSLAFDVRDESLIEELCTAAQESPTAVRALQWAILNNVKMTVGGTPHGVLGSYSCLSGKITMSEGLRDRIGAEEVGTLVHEIRHAWQDARGLLPHTSTAHHRLDRLDYAQAQNALCEADAAAFGKVVVLELSVGQAIARHIDRDGQRLEAMRQYFFAWFHESSGVYGRNLRQSHESSLAAAVSDATLPAPTGINPYDRAQVVNLGRDFFGNRNYITGISADVFLRRLLNPQNILRDHDTRYNAQVMGTDIRKLQMKNRHALLQHKRGGRW